jgi:hypothetical protein
MLVVLGVVEAVPVLYCTMDKWWPWPPVAVAVVGEVQVRMVDPVPQAKLPLILAPAQVNQARAKRPQQELPPAVVVAEVTIQVPVDPVESLVPGVQAESVTLL